MNRLALLALAAALAAPSLAASPALAQQPAAVAQPDDEEGKKQYWQNRYRELLKSVDQTRFRLEEDRRAYTKGKQRGRLRGGSRDEVVSRIQENEKRLVELQKQLDDFPNEARRAGVPPGWLRDVQVD